MDNKLFMEYITKVTFELLPEETVSLEVVRDEHGRLVKGPVLWMMETASIGNRLAANAVSTPEWDKWAKEMFYRGVVIFLLLPNSTTVTALMDDLFRAFKGKCRQTSQLVFVRKLQASSEAVTKLKAKHARLRAAGEEISSEELKKFNTVVKLAPEDVGKIVFGELTEDGFPAANLLWANHFTKSKIVRSAEKLGYNPFVCEKILGSSDRIRYELGQGTRTEQTDFMEEMEEHYVTLKERCEEEGPNSSVFNAILSRSSGPIERKPMAEVIAQALAATNKTASAGPIWFNLGGMMASEPELRRAREIQWSKWQDVEDATREKEKNAK